MSRYRKVDPRIWNDRKFRGLSDNAKLLFFMLLTHPGMTALGAMRGTLGGLAEELGWSAEAFGIAFREVLSEGMAEHDVEACLIALPRFVRYNPPESPNVIKAWTGALDLLPECDLKTLVVHRAGEVAAGMTEGFGKAFAQAFGQAMPYQEQEQEQKQEKNPPTPLAGQGGSFERFWNSWPEHRRKVAREQCTKRWQAMELDGIADTVLEALAVDKASEAWRKEAAEYIPAPLTWLRQARWEAPTEEQQALAVESQTWHQTRKGIVAKGVELGLGSWDEKAWEEGKGEMFGPYMARVYAAAGYSEKAPA